MQRKYQKYSLLCWLLGLFLFAGLTGCDDDESLDPVNEFRQELIGQWQSQASEFDEATQNYGFRTLEITADRWSIVVERFADEARTMPLFTLELTGPYEITGASEVLAGAYNGTFFFDEKHFTPHVDPALLGLGDCGLSVEVRSDITDLECAWLESVEHCPADYDLVSIEGNVLFPGQRTADMCSPEGRPTARGFAMNRLP